MNLKKRFMAWLWCKLFDFDPFVVFSHFETYEQLNQCHVEFLNNLEDNYPELFELIKQHMKKRAEICLGKDE